MFELFTQARACVLASQPELQQASSAVNFAAKPARMLPSAKGIWFNQYWIPQQVTALPFGWQNLCVLFQIIINIR